MEAAHLPPEKTQEGSFEEEYVTLVLELGY
jgi:hypothetical protein